MATTTKTWGTGEGSVTVTYNGSGNGTITVTSSDNNLHEGRSMTFTVKTTDNKKSQTITVSQAAKPYIDLSAAVVTAANQTYSGSALTPAVTVTLNGSTVPSTGYDVQYSNNINAGTATITITGKGDYTGTATGTFSIAKANPSYTAPAKNTLTYNGSSQYLITTGSTSHGTIYYSSDGSSWSTTRPSGTNAGTYSAYWKLTGDSNHNDVASTKITGISIGQKSLTITAKAQTVNYGTAISTGTSQVNTSGLVSGDSLTAVTLTASTNNVTTSGTITPSAATTSKGIGNYSVTYATGNLTINAVAPTNITAPTAKSSLTYNGSSKALVNAGSATGGTMYYLATTTNTKPSSTSGFSTSIPTGTNAGTYYIWYYVKGDSNHTNTAINTTAVSASIAKASRTLSFPNPITVISPSSTFTNIAVPSAGAGDGTLSYSSGTTSKATVNSSTGAVTGVAEGTSVITATISAGTNYNSASATYTITVQAAVKNYAYTGSVQNNSFPAAIYKLQVWGAQGGSNAADSSYGITAKEGGKGGYSVGILKLASASTLYAFVGGQGGSSGNGGWNGGGGGSGSSSYESGDTKGVSKMGCGGGGTDIALTTSSMSYSSYRNNRTDASLKSRMIVAGGGSGGAMCAKSVTTTEYTDLTFTFIKNFTYNGKYISQYRITGHSPNNVLRIINTNDNYQTDSNGVVHNRYISLNVGGVGTDWQDGEINYTCPNWAVTLDVLVWDDRDYTHADITKLSAQKVTQTTTITNDSQAGYVGGGTSGGGYSSTYQGKQNAAGTNGAFGKGANQTSSNYRYCSSCGGGGWYGGGSAQNDSTMSYVKYSGGGSGFVNIAANASSRPSSYTGLQLDQGTTYAGSTTFESTSGSTETGHAGDGYARITRVSPLDAVAELVYTKLDASNVEYSEFTNPEWQHVLVDSNDKILAGIRQDGTMFVSDYIQNL